MCIASTVTDVFGRSPHTAGCKARPPSLCAIARERAANAGTYGHWKHVFQTFIDILYVYNTLPQCVSVLFICPRCPGMAANPAKTGTSCTGRILLCKRPAYVPDSHVYVPPLVFGHPTLPFEGQKHPILGPKTALLTAFLSPKSRPLSGRNVPTSARIRPAAEPQHDDFKERSTQQ